MNKKNKIENKNFNIRDSQNFLHSSKLVNELLLKSNIDKEDFVVEIGPGKGIITKELSKICKSVNAIEYDSALANKLSNEFKNSNVNIIEMDFLKYNLPKNQQYKIFSNIPFNITASILNKLLGSENPPLDTFLIMQYEAFLKYAGEPFYKESYKSLLYKPFFNTSILYKFNKFDFRPTPNANIILGQFLYKDSADINLKDRDVWKDFLSFIFLEKGSTFKEKTKRIFSYNQQKIISKENRISDNLNISNWNYDFWLKIFKIYNSNMVSNDKKNLVKGSYKSMLEHESKLEKSHRNKKQNNRKRINNGVRKS